MKVIVAASGKGGTGKTLVAATLAIHFARQRKGDKSDGKVGIIDRKRRPGKPHAMARPSRPRGIALLDGGGR